MAILSGGNVVVGLLGTLAARNETRAGRRVRLTTRVTDSPGSLAKLLSAVANANANLITVEHVRDGVQLPIRQSGIALTVEVRDRAHLQEMLQDVRAGGFDVETAN